MTLIDLGDFKLRFDPKEVRINIDGDMIDIGAKREEQTLIKTDLTQKIGVNYTIDPRKNIIKEISKANSE